MKKSSSVKKTSGRKKRVRKQDSSKKFVKSQTAPPKKQASKPTVPKIAPIAPVRRMPKVFDSGLRDVPDQPIGQRLGTGYRMAADRIDGETIIGDLIVVFPRTREALLRHGLKLDVDEAGDIYMTLDAFAAIHGLKTSALVEELIEVSRQPPPPLPPPTPAQQQQQQQRMSQLASPPSAS